MRAHPNVIGTFLRSWEGTNNLRRWYYNKWERFLAPSQILEYRAIFGIDPTDSEYGIKVFFDEDGYLHIDNCRDPILGKFLENKMTEWYLWARDEYRRKQGYPSMNVLEMIEPYTEMLKPGFYQTRYKGLVFNFDEEMRFQISEKYLPFDHSRPGYIVMTGYPKLNSILKNMIDEESEFPSIVFGSVFGPYRNNPIDSLRSCCRYDWVIILSEILGNDCVFALSKFNIYFVSSSYLGR